MLARKKRKITAISRSIRMPSGKIKYLILSVSTAQKPASGARSGLPRPPGGSEISPLVSCGK